MGFTPSQEDPFYELTKPTADETPAQPTTPQKPELDAQPASEFIDEEIKLEKRKELAKNIRILLLGQAESGVCFFTDALCI